MFKKLAIIISLFLLVFNPLAVNAQEVRGMGIDYTNEASDIQDLSSWNANVLRYSLYWHGDADTATLEEYNTWLDGALDQLDIILAAADAIGSKVSVTLYSPPGGFTQVGKSYIHTVFLQEWAHDAIIEVWKKIAQRYATDTRVHSYELMNEPSHKSVDSSLENWNELAQTLADTVRAYDTLHPLIVTARNGDLGRLKSLKPISDTNVYYAFHFYFPMSFTHQGIYSYKLGKKYPKKNNKNPKKSLNKKKLKKKLKKAKRFSKKNKVNGQPAKMWVTEVTVCRGADEQSAVKYLTQVLSIFENWDFNWFYHIWRGAHFWSLEHGNDLTVFTKSPTETDRAKLIKSYFAKNS